MRIATIRRGVLSGVLAVALCVTGCAAERTATPVAVPPIPPGQARLWVYRDYQPSESLNLAAFRINGTLAGYARPAGEAFYRDVRPGAYHISVASYGTDFGQASNVDLEAGEEAYVKIESLDAWTTGGDLGSFKRDTFYARLVSPQLARTEIRQLRVGKGG